MAASPARDDAQSSAGVQQATDAPVLKKTPRPRKPKADDTVTQPADTAPVAVRDKSGRFVKKQNPLPVPEQQSAPVPAPAKGTKSAPASAVVPGAVESGATARCQDGSFSHSRQHSGSCSRHGGVAQWLAE
ncbi:DUF3761 domain-containing protein [Enterobacter asburiae]|uniref:DUF3761 domain-containing protein n=1 Tax=Enterobacter asburiae TaxID=61645 RepID=UPI0021CE68B0|nr:DUF3761 domain-containing protein [Enterobacter asburiae]MCU6244221.1 DUF3761 domain-containing protein [Enterobacter asburiae]